MQDMDITYIFIYFDVATLTPHVIEGLELQSWKQINKQP